MEVRYQLRHSPAASTFYRPVRGNQGILAKAWRGCEIAHPVVQKPAR